MAEKKKEPKFSFAIQTALEAKSLEEFLDYLQDIPTEERGLKELLAKQAELSK